MDVERHEREEHGQRLPFVVFRLPSPRLAVASATLGGGLGPRHWVLNATVSRGYDRDDPAAHLAELAAQAGLVGPGVGLMTAVDVRRLVTTSDGGASVHATVGVEEPSWAAAPSPEWHATADAARVGTINVVVDLPVRLDDGALVNVVATATEAKAQAMADAGWAGTGTPTDAVCVLCPLDGSAEPYGGPRSVWGSRVARAVHAAVLHGLAHQDDPL